MVLGLAAVVLRDKVVDSDKRPGGTGHQDHLDKTCGLHFLDIPLYLHTHTCGIVVDSLGVSRHEIHELAAAKLHHFYALVNANEAFWLLSF